MPMLHFPCSIASHHLHPITTDQFNAREKVVEEINEGEEERGLYVGMQDILPLY